MPWVLELIRPASVVDVGCGSGPWLAACLKLGMTDGMGLDGPWVPLESLEFPRQLLRRVDLTKPLGESRRFDLAICVEVAEHLDPSAAETIVDTLTSLAPVVLFSASVPGQRGHHHVNEQWPSYWAAKFSTRGYQAYDPLRPRLWNDPAVGWWYAQNLILYVSRDAELSKAAREQLAGSAVREPLPLVHPRMLAAIEQLHGQELDEARSPRQALRNIIAAVPGRLQTRVTGVRARSGPQ